MSLKRTLKWTALVLVAVLVIAVLYLWFGNLDWIAGKVEEIAEESTGRALEFGGEFELDALWSPSLVAENITFENAEWGSEPQLASVGHVSAQVDLWSLISGPIHVTEVRLHDVRVLIETNAEGESNLDMGADEPEPEEAPAEPSPDAEVPLVVEFAEIRNVELVIRAPEAEDRVVTIDSLDLTTNEALHLVLDGKGLLNDYDWALAGTAGPLGAVKRGDDIQLALEGAVGNLELALEGYIATLREIRGSELDVEISSEDVVPLVETLQLPLDVTGELLVDVSLNALDDDSTVAGNVTFGDIAADIAADLSPGEIDFETTIDDLAKIGAATGTEGLPHTALTLAGGVSITETAYELRDVSARIGELVATVSGTVGKTPEVTTLVQGSVAGPTLHNVSPKLPDIPFAVEAGVEYGAERIVLEPFSATIGESVVTAELEILQGEMMSVLGKLHSERIDLSPFLPEPGEDTDGETAHLEEFEEGDDPFEEEGEPSEYVFTSDPLPLERLHASNVDLEVDIGELVGGIFSAEAIRADLGVADGRAWFDGGFRSAIGGEIDADVELVDNAGVGELRLEMFARDLRPTIFSEGIEDTSKVPPLDITVDMETSGASARAMAEAADGVILITMSPGLVSNSGLSLFSGDLLGELLGALNPFSKEDPYNQQDCAIFEIKMEDGVADIAQMYIQGEKVTIIGNGRIDLTTEKLRLEFNTKPRTGIGVSADMFVTPFVKLGGTLASPRIGLSKSGALLTGGAAVLTGGLSILARGAADRLSGGADRCEATLAETSGHPPIEGLEQAPAQSPTEPPAEN